VTSCVIISLRDGTDAFRKVDTKTAARLTRHHPRAYPTYSVTTILDVGIDPAQAMRTRASRVKLLDPVWRAGRPW